MNSIRKLLWAVSISKMEMFWLELNNDLFCMDNFFNTKCGVSVSIFHVERFKTAESELVWAKMKLMLKIINNNRESFCFFITHFFNKQKYEKLLKG